MRTTQTNMELDSELLAAVARADEAAYARLYQRYARRIQQYAYSLVRDRTAAEEVLIETMSVLWRSAANFACGSSVSTWILGIARHKALDVLRKTERQQAHVPLQEAAELPDPAVGPGESIDRDRMGQLTRAAMAHLSSEHREILRLVFYEELRYEEIAALLSIPANTVKSRVYYAKKQLRRQLERIGAGEPV